jgi:heat shock protein HslJ
MKATMGFGFFLLFLAGLALVMLQGQEMARQNLPGGGAELTGKNWRPVIVGDDTMPAEHSAFIHFAVDGSINGNTGCNNFFGTLTSTDDGISMGEVGATRMACPPEIMQRETDFLEALQATSQFELSGNTLKLLDGDGEILMELIASE